MNTPTIRFPLAPWLLPPLLLFGCADGAAGDGEDGDGGSAGIFAATGGDLSRGGDLGGGGRTGSGAGDDSAAPSCTGEALACETHTSTTCAASTGCVFTGGRCTGTPIACASLTGQACADQPGCTDVGTDLPSRQLTASGCRIIAANAFEWLSTPAQGVPVVQTFGLSATALGSDGHADGVHLWLLSAETGTFELGVGIETNTTTCSRCVLAVEDIEGAGSTGALNGVHSFMATAGTLTVDAATPADQARSTGLRALLSEVVLSEVTLERPAGQNTPDAQPVPGGACLYLQSASVQLPAP